MKILVPVVLLFGFLTGCATGQPHAPISDENQRQLDTEAAHYLNCMKVYAHAHALGDATPEDIAGAAEATCKDFLSSYQLLYARALNEIPFGERHAKDPLGEAAHQADSVSESGRQLVMKTVAEERSQIQ